MAHSHNTEDVRQRLWREIDKGTTVMLGLTGDPAQHFQPMTAFCEKDEGGPVWFYVRKDNDLVRQAGQGRSAMFNFMNRSHDFIACVAGALQADHDPERIQRFWNPVVAAWFPEGKDDPNLTLLRFDPEDAQVWLSHGNPIRFGWEIAKANLTKTQPDVGDTAHLRL
jgi:general stress protein 26